MLQQCKINISLYGPFVTNDIYHTTHPGIGLCLPCQRLESPYYSGKRWCLLVIKTANCRQRTAEKKKNENQWFLKK
jgi:hypothetical protein